MDGLSSAALCAHHDDRNAGDALTGEAVPMNIFGWLRSRRGRALTAPARNVGRHQTRMLAPWKYGRDECGWSSGAGTPVAWRGVGCRVVRNGGSDLAVGGLRLDLAVGLAFIVWPLLAAFGVVVVVTMNQVRRGRTPTTFEPTDTAVAALVAAGSCLALTFLGHVGWVVMAIGLPTALLFLALARVRPDPKRRAAVIVVFAVGVVPYVMWFVR